MPDIAKLQPIGHTVREETTLSCGCVHEIVGDEPLMPAARPCAEHPQREIAPSWDDILGAIDRHPADEEPDLILPDDIAKPRMQDELDDIAWCNRNGWYAGGL